MDQIESREETQAAEGRRELHAPLEPAEVEAILKAATNPVDYALICVLLFTGFRIGDGSMLRRDQVDFTTGTVMFRIQKTRKTSYMKLQPPLE